MYIQMEELQTVQPSAGWRREADVRERARAETVMQDSKIYVEGVGTCFGGNKDCSFVKQMV